jgi:hypothetical protein
MAEGEQAGPGGAGQLGVQRHPRLQVERAGVGVGQGDDRLGTRRGVAGRAVASSGPDGRARGLRLRPAGLPGCHGRLRVVS